MNKQDQKEKDRKQRLQHDKDSGRDIAVSVLCCLLEQLFAPKVTDILPSDRSQITMFHTESVPMISISAYLQRLAKYIECSSEVLIQSIIHINRILHHRPNFIINSLNIHRLLLTSLLCSAKFFDDTYFNNEFYARVGGIGVKELNCLEVEFLTLINFDLFVRFQVYRDFYVEISSAKLHMNCNCNFRSMPQLYPEDVYHPVLIKDNEPEWDVDLMMKLYSHSPKPSNKKLINNNSNDNNNNNNTVQIDNPSSEAIVKISCMNITSIILNPIITDNNNHNNNETDTSNNSPITTNKIFSAVLVSNDYVVSRTESSVNTSFELASNDD